jgi:hypothetical protein
MNERRFGKEPQRTALVWCKKIQFDVFAIIAAMASGRLE